MEKWARIKYQPCLPLGKDGRLVSSSDEHIAFSRKAAGEGMVLLKNDGILPLERGTKVAVFGKAQIDYVKGGGGSGEVFCKYIRNINDGLKCKEEEGKVEVFDKLADFYKKNLTYGEKKLPGFSVEPELPEHLVKEAREYTNTAVITICRYSGEAWDRSSQKGDFYLSDAEEKMVDTVCKNFENIVVVLDVGGLVDTEWFKENDKIGAALYASNGGMEGGLAIADILTGDVNPSGKLTDTFAKSFDDYPSSEHFHDSEAYVKYYEDIYVGYRFFETIPEAKEKVNYPFGFGLSYTTFNLNNINVTVKENRIYVEVKVENTGTVAGKEVVQVYYSAPQGMLGKPARELIGFKKTRLLEPGEYENILIEFDVDDMASFDDLGKLKKSAWILEKGEYSIFVGTSVRDTVKTDFSYNVNEEFKVVKQLSQQMTPRNLEKRLCADGSFEDFPLSMPEKIEYVIPEGIEYNPKKEKIKLIDVAEDRATLDEFVAQLDRKYLIDLVRGKPTTGVSDTCGMGSTIGRMGGVDEYGVPCAMTCDGPAGVRIQWDCDVKTTAFPCATLLASTWNTDILYEVGRLGALEVKENNMAIWLTPALNIHRSPLCGRNFEYFSEDPLLSGKMAAAEVRGIQSEKIAASVKHFACNNKETNRMESDSIVSERALREIYLKGFEICIKESDPWTLMSAYNLINGVRASENYDMLTNILRNEWGYKGMVTTDWNNKASHAKEIYAGNDVRMPIGYTNMLDNLIKDSQFPFLQQSAKRIFNMLLNLE